MSAPAVPEDLEPVAMANALLAFCGIPATVRALGECNPSMFILIAESLFQTRIRGVVRTPQSVEDAVKNADALLRFLHSYDLPRDLSQVTPERLAYREPGAVATMIDLLHTLQSMLEPYMPMTAPLSPDSDAYLTPREIPSSEEEDYVSTSTEEASGYSSTQEDDEAEAEGAEGSTDLSEVGLSDVSDLDEEGSETEEDEDERSHRPKHRHHAGDRRGSGAVEAEDDSQAQRRRRQRKHRLSAVEEPSHSDKRLRLAAGMGDTRKHATVRRPATARPLHRTGGAAAGAGQDAAAAAAARPRPHSAAGRVSGPSRRRRKGSRRPAPARPATRLGFRPGQPVPPGVGAQRAQAQQTMYLETMPSTSLLQEFERFMRSRGAAGSTAVTQAQEARAALSGTAAAAAAAVAAEQRPESELPVPPDPLAVFDSVPADVRRRIQARVLRFRQLKAHVANDAEKLARRRDAERRAHKEAFARLMLQRVHDTRAMVAAEEQRLQQRVSGPSAYRQKVDRVSAQRMREDELRYERQQNVRRSELQGQEYLRLFEQTLDREMTRLRMERRALKEKLLQEVHQREVNEEAKERFYREQFSMAQERLAEERRAQEAAFRAQRREIERLEREVRLRMREDVNALRAKAMQENEARFRREVDALSNAATASALERAPSPVGLFLR